MAENRNNKSKIISLISGKGGVGKTAVCSSIGYLLAELGFKTLMIDADLGTFGLTYFFIDQATTEDTKSVIDIATSGPKSIEKAIQDSSPAIISENLFLIPAITKFNGTDFASNSENPYDIIFSDSIFGVLQKIVDRYRGEVDYILLDAQAGAVPATKACIELSDIAITVMEADPVGMWAVRTLERQFSTAYSRTNVFYLANKLFIEEVSQYKAITEYLRAFSHLPPLPFDFEVRRAFAHRVIPIDLKKPSAFFFAMLRLIRDLLPAIERNINQLEATTSKAVFEPIKSEINNVEEEIKSVESSVKNKVRKSAVRGRLIQITLSIYFIAMFLLFTYRAIGSKDLLANLVANPLFPSIILLLSFLLMSLSFPEQITDFFINLIKKSSMIAGSSKSVFDEDEDKDVLLRKLDDLMARRRSLETMLLTQKEDLMYSVNTKDKGSKSI